MVCRMGCRVSSAVGVEGRKLFPMAGLRGTWSANGAERRSGAIVTTEVNVAVGELHDRVPVIHEPNEEARRHDRGDPDALSALLVPFPDERTTCHNVTAAVNDPANGRPRQVEPVGDDRTGLDEFH